ncbi:MAG: hypothetical protein P4M14_05095 [Gammaproteobacteria bacterium]|nr:hypothetical protein [Gammaproteobacteria bacterium]
MSRLSLVVFGMLFVLGLVLMNDSYAYDTAKLQMKIAGVKNNAYYLCVSNSNGCTSMVAANGGKIFPMDTGNVSYIYAANPYNQKIYPLHLPDSCKVMLAKDQTLTVKGNLVVKKAQKTTDADVQINHLHCVVT